MIDYALRWVNHGGGRAEGIDTQFDIAIRQWAAYEGYEIADRGRIPTAYDAAH